MPKTPRPLGASHQRVLDAVRRWPGRTSAELAQLEAKSLNLNLWRARFSELEQRGMIERTERGTCSVTGRLAWTWEATKRTTPKPPLNLPSRRELINELCCAYRVLTGVSPHDQAACANRIKALVKRAVW